VAGLGVCLNALVVVQVVGGPGSLAFAQPYATGEECNTGSQCSSTFCVDGVCCSQAFCPAGQRCDLPNHEGTCTPTNPAPALSLWAQGFVASALLVFALRRLSRRSRAS
jgi:hypothetical protein